MKNYVIWGHVRIIEELHQLTLKIDFFLNEKETEAAITHLFADVSQGPTHRQTAVIKLESDHDTGQGGTRGLCRNPGGGVVTGGGAVTGGGRMSVEVRRGGRSRPRGRSRVSGIRDGMRSTGFWVPGPCTWLPPLPLPPGGGGNLSPNRIAADG